MGNNLNSFNLDLEQIQNCSNCCQKADEEKTNKDLHIKDDDKGETKGHTKAPSEYSNQTYPTQVFYNFKLSRT